MLVEVEEINSLFKIQWGQILLKFSSSQILLNLKKNNPLDN